MQNHQFGVVSFELQLLDEKLDDRMDETLSVTRPKAHGAIQNGGTLVKNM